MCATGATDAASVINSNGTINFNTSATIKCDLPLFNNGGNAALNVLQGTLEFTKGAKQGGLSISQSAGSVNISSGATLKADANTLINGGVLTTVGTGTANLTGNLTVQAGSVQISTGPGAGGYGQLGVYGQVELTGTSVLQIAVDGSGTACDQIAASGTITLGGSAKLVVNTAGGPPHAVYWILYSGIGISGDFSRKDYTGADYTTSIVANPIVGYDYELTPA